MSRKYPWKTSNTLIEDVKREISMPIYQSTFTPEDILSFADDEMAMGQVPSVMMYNEEYFVYTEYVPLVENKTKYPIPSRAIGMKLRDLHYADTQGNLAEMTRISPDDKSAYQDEGNSYSRTAKAFYLENNNIVIYPGGQSSLQGYLVMSYYLRANQLAVDERAAFIASFSNAITVDNTTISDGDIVSINGNNFTAKTSGASTNEFNIGASSSDTATNLAASIDTASIGVTATAASAVVSLSVTNLSILLKHRSNKLPDLVNKNVSSTNILGFVVSDTIKIKCTAAIDTEIFSTSVPVDFLEFAGGHRTKNYDVTINAIDSDTFSFSYTDIPLDFVVGDYICVQYECIIPQIPSDLHSNLVERTCERMLSSIGDREGSAELKGKIMENEKRQGILLDNRTEGNPKKIAGRHTLLRYQKIRGR